MHSTELPRPVDKFRSGLHVQRRQSIGQDVTLGLTGFAIAARPPCGPSLGVRPQPPSKSGLDTRLNPPATHPYSYTSRTKQGGRNTGFDSSLYKKSTRWVRSSASASSACLGPGPREAISTPSISAAQQDRRIPWNYRNLHARCRNRMQGMATDSAEGQTLELTFEGEFGRTGAGDHFSETGKRLTSPSRLAGHHRRALRVGRQLRCQGTSTRWATTVAVPGSSVANSCFQDWDRLRRVAAPELLVSPDSPGVGVNLSLPLGRRDADSLLARPTHARTYALSPRSTTQ